ncbi:MAG: hypothetical protein WC736_09630 [Gallionella sp.]|jgi:hypothetical protein
MAHDNFLSETEVKLMLALTINSFVLNQLAVAVFIMRSEAFYFRAFYAKQDRKKIIQKMPPTTGGGLASGK